MFAGPNGSPELCRSFSWAPRLLDCSRQLMSVSDIEKSFFVTGQGSDSDFTGGAAGFEVATTLLTTAAMQNGWYVDLCPRSTCEIDSTMRRMLQNRFPHECHVFGDILDIFGDGRAAYNHLNSISSYRDKIAWANQVPTSKTAWCFQHDQYCDLFTGATLRCGGFPCQDFSQAGMQQGTSGKQAPVVAAFGRKTKELANPLLTIENVDRCPTDVVHDTFSSEYQWYCEACFDPAAVGFDCIRRSRLYMGALHESSATCVIDPGILLQHTMHCIGRDPPLKPGMLMVAGTNDFWQDCWHLTSGDSGRGKRSSDQLLLAAEQARLDDYVSKFWELPHTNRCDYSDLVVHLGDSPATGWVTWSARHGVMPTIRRTGGLYYVPCLGRHLTLREMYLSMGYPTYVQYVGYDASLAYRVFTPQTSWWDARRALGNSMHVAQVGCFVGSLLLSSRSKESGLPLSELFQIMDRSLWQ
mmetsp:Transcript_61052/g.133698  ORF Transcript_61052/g.133698 Transcript_61052/m.133698 type:complete len:469 (+) Transcript_61052:1-1407(+)